MLELAKDTFEAEVLQAEGTVFVDFYGDGCVPCAALMPFVHEMADKYGDKIKFCALNPTKARRLAISLEAGLASLCFPPAAPLAAEMCGNSRGCAGRTVAEASC